VIAASSENGLPKPPKKKLVKAPFK
jgi:hypothetical protein